MKKIWIVYNTKSGNCKKACEEVGKKFGENYNITVKQISETSPEQVAEENPDILLVGSRIVIGNPDKAVRKFVKKLGSALKSPIPKAATLYTHAEEWNPTYAKMTQILKVNKIAGDICPELLEIKMEKIKGPAEPDQDVKIDVFIKTISDFIEK